MKNPKKAIKTIYKKYEVINYQVECPYCHTTLMGGAINSKEVLMFSCYHCGNPIDLREKK